MTMKALTLSYPAVIRHPFPSFRTARYSAADLAASVLILNSMEAFRSPENHATTSATLMLSYAVISSGSIPIVIEDAQRRIRRTARDQPLVGRMNVQMRG